MLVLRSIIFTSIFRHLSAAAASMKKEQIVPDVIDVAPEEIAEVTYPSGIKVDLGNELTPTKVKDPPTIKWKAEDGSRYAICITDPDAPSRKEPKFREWIHWLVGNVPGIDVSKGDTLAAFIGAGPPRGSGLHRYVFLVYKQDGMIKFDEKRLNNRTADDRAGFSIRKFADKYKLGQPIAGNFFQAQWDDYVPVLYKQLGA